MAELQELSPLDVGFLKTGFLAPETLSVQQGGTLSQRLLPRHA